MKWIKKIINNKCIKLTIKNKKLKKKLKKTNEELEKLKRFNTKLQATNYEISYNNLDLLEQIKKYKKRNRQIREEKIEMERMIKNDNGERTIQKNK